MVILLTNCCYQWESSLRPVAGQKREFFHFSQQNCETYIKLKSCADDQTATFGTLQSRLLQFLSSRIDNGEFTERGLARIIGVSQPQFHNVLRGKRKLQTKLADRILQKFEMSVLDLFHETELREQLIARSSAQAQGGREIVTCLKRAGTDPEPCPRKPLGREVVHRPPVRDLAS